MQRNGETAPVILLTGFEPFAQRSINASWEAVRRWQGSAIRGHRVETLLLPVVYDALDALLRDAIASFSPRAVIAFGEGTAVVKIETVARNGYAANARLDNANRAQPRTEIVPGGAAEIPTGLPVEALLAALKTGGIAAKTSTDAGGYLCNECFYRLMLAPGAPAPRGFIHVPILGTQDPGGGVFDLEKLAEAVRIAAETALCSAE